jgi:flagellar L-ring protein precursor FlgH
MGVIVHTRKVILCLPLLALGACSAAPPRIDAFNVAEPIAAAPPADTGGAIYQAGYDVPLFENSVAHRVGDVLTILLEEKTDASKSASTTTAKKTKADLPGPTLFGAPITMHGKEIFAGGMNNASSFDGAGGSKQSNVLNGSISVTIARRLANGNLLVRGQKLININQGSEYVRLQGIVRSIDIAPDNTVSSSRVADASISYGSQGVLASANSKGWLARFFDSKWLPF